MGALLLVALAVHLGAHVAITVGLAQGHPRWYAAVGFFVPPLGAWWAAGKGMRVRVWVWALSVLAYAIVLAVLRA